MRVLFDTHTYVWWITGHGRLSVRAREVVAAPGTELLLSAVVPWEIAIKVRAGKWPGGEQLLADISDAVADEQIQPLAITHAHGVRAGLLATKHRDPFDRMLAAQAQLESAAIVTVDRVFRDMDVEVVW